MNFWLVQAINGISYGMLLFLVAAGLSLVFGLMNIINLAHGSYYMLGTYIGITVYRYSQNFILAVVGAAIALAILGVLTQRFILHRLYGNHLGQVLLTFGFVFIIADISLLVWGGYVQNMPASSLFKGSTTIGATTFPTYRLLVIGVGLLVALFLWWFQKGTKMGVAVRAAVDDEEMSQAIGLNVPLTTTAVFGISAALAALGGVMGGPFIGVYPGVDLEVLLLALVVVIIGGLGSLRGAFIGSILVGLLDNFGKALFPNFLFSPSLLRWPLSWPLDQTDYSGGHCEANEDCYRTGIFFTLGCLANFSFVVLRGSNDSHAYLRHIWHESEYPGGLLWIAFSRARRFLWCGSIYFWFSCPQGSPQFLVGGSGWCDSIVGCCCYFWLPRTAYPRCLLLDDHFSSFPSALGDCF